MYRLATRLSDPDNEVIACLPSKDGIASWYNDKEVRTAVIPSPPVSFQRTVVGQFAAALTIINTVVQLATLLRREEIDVLHVNEFRYLYALVSGVFGGAATVCHVRTILEPSYQRLPIVLFIYLLSDRVICVSEATKEQMFSHWLFDDNKVVVVRDPHPDEDRILSGDGDSFRSEHGIDPESTLVVSISKLVPSKGQDKLTAAFGEIDIDRPAELAVVGGKFSGYEEYARRLKQTYGDEPDIHVTGFYANIADVYDAADVMAHVPQNEDPFPNVVLEAMLAELPVIGTDSGGISEQVKHERTGYVVGKQRSDIRDGLELILLEPETCRTMAEAANRRVTEVFSPPEYYETINMLYEELTAQQK